MIALFVLASRLAVPLPPSPVLGGERVAGCAWPTAVRVGDCSGVLVDREIVVTAAHCETTSRVRLGAGDAEHDAWVDTVQCHRREGWAPSDGTDIQWCRLAVPQDNVAIVPPAMGCELEAAVVGAPVTIVGFGLTETGAWDLKHAARTEITEPGGPEIAIGGDGIDSCVGDSGAPAYLELPGDGGWRLLAITSHGPFPCGAGGHYTPVSPHVAWIEETSGVDITPCHDADGTWNPDARCGGFPLDPGGDHRTGDACTTGSRTAAVSTCGAPIAWTPDEPAEGERAAQGCRVDGHAPSGWVMAMLLPMWRRRRAWPPSVRVVS